MSPSQFYFLVAFLVYLSVMILISWYASRWQRSRDDFLLAGRSVPLLLTLGTTVATMVGTGSSMGAVGFAYQHAWAGSLYGLGGAVGILLLAWLFAPARQQGFVTMSEELASYVGHQACVKKVLSVVIFCACIGWLGAHLIGGGMYLAWLTGLEETTAKLMIGVGLAIYITIGGYSAVVWTDAIQAVILFLGFLLMAYFAVELLGGWEALKHHQSNHNSGLLSYRNIGLLPAISMATAILVGVLATPSFRQRIYAANNVQSIRRSFALSGLLYLGFALIPAVIGISAYAINSELDNPAFAFPFMALHALPLALGGFILLAGISATLSSASSDAIAAVSVLVSDLYQWLGQRELAANQQLVFSRLAMLFTVGLALTLAVIADNIISYITQMIALVLSGLCVVGVLGRFWSGYTWQGSLASLLAGSMAALVVNSNTSWLQYFGNPVLPALVSATCFGVVVSWLTQQPANDDQTSNRRVKQS